MLEQNIGVLPGGERGDGVAVGEDGEDFGVGGEGGIADEGGFDALGDKLGYHVVGGGGIVFAGGAGAGALGGHAFVEGGLVHGEIFFAGHQDGEVVGEAVGVVQLEGLVAGEDGGFVLLEFGDGFVEQGDAAVEGVGEGFFFGAEGADNFGAARGEFGEKAAHLFFEDGEEFAGEGFVEAEVAAEAGGAAQEAAQDVAAAVVGGHDAIGDGEG